MELKDRDKEEVKKVLKETRMGLKQLSVKDLRKNREIFLKEAAVTKEITGEVRDMFLKLYDEVEAEKSRWGDVV